MPDFCSLWTNFTSSLNPADIALATIILKVLWWRINDFVFNKVFKSPSRLVQIAKMDLEKYLHAQQLDSSTQAMLQTTRNRVRWLPPIVGIFKLNWDAAINSNDSKMGIGLIIRDHSRFFLACLSSSRSFNSKPILAECVALQRALLFL